MTDNQTSLIDLEDREINTLRTHIREDNFTSGLSGESKEEKAFPRRQDLVVKLFLRRVSLGFPSYIISPVSVSPFRTHSF
jgi:hypothetical protein